MHLQQFSKTKKNKKKFQKHIFLECPKFEELTTSLNFCHVIGLYNMYNMELSKPVKIAYDLNNECLNPQTIEKTKVSLAARIFGEPTRSTFIYYVKNGQPKWERTLNFLKLIARW